VTLSPPLEHHRRERHDAVQRRSAELLIREARQLQRRRRNLIGAVLLTVVLAVIPSILLTRPSKDAPASAVSVNSFIASMKRADETSFVATYRTKTFSFFQDGNIVVAQIPSPPGTKGVENRDGYSGTGKYSYIFYGDSGHLIRQWIKINTNVQACVKWPTTPDKNVVCGRPGPYLPSNGYAEEDVGLIPTYILQEVEIGETPRPIDRLSTRSSMEFGQLRCLNQVAWSQTTCIDRSGYVVSYLVTNGPTYVTGVTLTKLSHHPTASNFVTLVKPTAASVLPPI
jgi:hypothetical protein